MSLFKKPALRDVATAAKAADEAASKYGRDSQKARIARESVEAEVYDARQAGATDAEIRAARRG